MDEPQSTIIEVTASVTADEAWRALRDPAVLADWFGWDADTLAAEIQYIFFDHAREDAAARVLRFEGMPDRFEVEPRGDGSAIRLVRSGSTRSEEDWGAVYDDMITGWITFVRQLAFSLNQGRRGRRTLYLSGMAADATAPVPSRALGLDGLRAGAPGDRCDLAGPGERLTGRLEFVTALQTGLSVDGWGGGLLVLTDRPHGAGGLAEPGGYAVLTTSGLDDGAFADLERRWTAWWSERYPDDRPHHMEPDSPYGGQG